MDQNIYRQLSEAKTGSLLKELETLGFSYKKNEESSSNCTLLDDHDWHIWQTGSTLLSQNDKLALIDHEGKVVVNPKNDATARFWWDLPPGPLTDRIRQLIDVRAFVARDEFCHRIEQGSVLNRDDKIVVRIIFHTIVDSADQPFYFVELHPLRGYQREFSRVADSLSQLTLATLDNCSPINLLEKTDLDVVIPSNKPSFQLLDDEPAETAVARMAVTMLELARHQEEGIVEDTDTEFVHQYRVNIRKTRSLISLFRKCLSGERYRVLKGELKQVGSRTNDLRDLDVFLLDHDYYRDMLPQNLHAGFERLFRIVKRRRKSACSSVTRTLQSESYQQQFDLILGTLRQPPDLSSSRSRMPIKQLTSRKILSQYNRICSDSAAINDETPDEAVHDLRIECKKLRYLLELFGELFAKDRVKALIKHLKGLQDNLGRFNDYSVQQDFLLQLRQNRSLSDDALASLNGLTAVLYNKQRHERGLVVENISRFIEPSIAEQFSDLFDTPARKDLKQ